MHFQISKSYFITWNGSRSANICIFLCTSRFSKLIISKVLVLEVHRFDHFYALPDFQNLFPEVHRFGNFYALPDFQNLFYHKKWFQKCIDLILFMHFQISKSYFITWSGSRSAYFTALPDFQNLLFLKYLFWKCIDLIIFMHFQMSKSYSRSA